MESLPGFLAISCFCFFLVAAIITLINNSAAILLSHGIFVQSSYPATSLLKRHIKSTSDIRFKKSLKKALVLRKLHQLFIMFSLISGVFLVILTFK
ncbi:hypothetical protein J8L88_21565 [Aquimarina sp. MMG015]|uniref:hypothetical protein n=1 Tax=Aquimarina sp. MMG015 TaxID=2822689 RepID=UPI001B39F942|nr:hypothetical protein [Aquimarina sp. MMG015]MBQ4805465.1 hypothetical protein [Aquimarina sp. MMG015]